MKKAQETRGYKNTVSQTVRLVDWELSGLNKLPLDSHTKIRWAFPSIVLEALRYHVLI